MTPLTNGQTFRDRITVVNDPDHCFTLYYKDPATPHNLEPMGWITYNEMTKELIFKNKGKIPNKCILLGGSTKMKDLNFIGKFGEGFKVAALVLLRGYDLNYVKDNKSVP